MLLAHTYILTNWETEIKRIAVGGQSKKITWKTPISKITGEKWTGGLAEVIRVPALQGQSPEFKPQFHFSLQKKVIALELSSPTREFQFYP
jgi:hypothetical protein